MIPHALVYFDQLSNGIIIGNTDVNNTQPLMILQDNLEIVGFKLDGLSAESLILKIEAGGGLELTETEVEKATIDN